MDLQLKFVISNAANNLLDVDIIRNDFDGYEPTFTLIGDGKVKVQKTDAFPRDKISITPSNIVMAGNRLLLAFAEEDNNDDFIIIDTGIINADTSVTPSNELNRQEFTITRYKL